MLMKFADRYDGKWMLGMVASLALPLLILIFQPIGLSLRQSAVVASVLLTVTWWSSGLVRKIPASLFLIAVFLTVSGAGLRKVFAFPLSETFPMIIVTYLFSQAISNAGLIEKLFMPPLMRFVHTPVQCMAAITLLFYVTMYMIPQPIARVILVAALFDHFLKRTTLPETARPALLYGVFLMSAAVNMSARDADIIMNPVAASFAPVPVSNGTWVFYMLPPTLVCCALVIMLFLLVFRKELRGQRLEAKEALKPEPFTPKQKKALAVIAGTVALWMTSGLHGINNTLVTVAATGLLFAVGALRREDLKTIDVTTLIFLTAAFAIGGVTDACGAAERVFGVCSGLFSGGFSLKYLWMMVLVDMALHMMLGSNTTTLSVVVPGMMILCSGEVPPPAIVFIAIVSESFHAPLPFHSVSVMLGSESGYYPGSYVSRVGVPSTLLVFFVAAFVYLPYWKLTGLM